MFALFVWFQKEPYFRKNATGYEGFLVDLLSEIGRLQRFHVVFLEDEHRDNVSNNALNIPLVSTIHGVFNVSDYTYYTMIGSRLVPFEILLIALGFGLLKRNCMSTQTYCIYIM